MKNRFYLLLIPILFLPFFAFSAKQYSEEAKDIADKLRCPICQGQSVKESTTVIAENMKTEIQEQLESGKSEAEVLAFFESRYGEWILRVPKKEGINLLLWIVPFVSILAFGIFVFYKFKTWNKAAIANAETAPLSPEEQEKFGKYFIQS